jgi:EAL domain-containing protein (putative c-di-GMP-specific phosphodiesterase class I)
LHYQPIIDLNGERVCGAEALLRWRHPERGFVPPATFIPLAEQLGLIEQIGAWVLRKACYEASFWPLDMRIAVNVSAVQFEQAGLIETVVQALAASGLSPTRLELEITETVLMREGTGVGETLEQLRALGVRMALDDFGTGYSSLSYLRNFRFDKLKLDRSFVADLAHPDVKRIVQAIMALGQGLNMTITAEGVETQAQLDIVRAKGCDEVQGYYFSRPLTATDFRSFIGCAAAGQAEVA